MKTIKLFAQACAMRLRRTSQYNDLLDLVYVQEPKGRSYVLAVFAGGRKRINTSGDSGWGMIIDIIRQLPGA